MPYGTGLRRASCPTRTWSGTRPVSSVWGRWFIWLVGVFLLAYRPGFWYPQDIEFLAIPVLLGVVNALVHHRLLTNRTATWRWMLLLCATDIALVTFGVVIGGGFRSFIFLAHYPTLAVFCRGLLVLLAQPGLDHGGRPGCGIAGAWRARSGLPGGAWWTGFSQKHPSGDRA